MPLLSDTVVAVALAAVFIVLVLGLWNMMRGGSPSRSQALMRWRVGLQVARSCRAAGMLSHPSLDGIRKRVATGR